MNYLTFGSERDKLRMVVENGVDASDPRVMTRTNEAMQLLLSMRDKDTHERIIPVNAMMYADIPVTDGFMLLPPIMESVIHVSVIGSEDLVNNQSDVRQGFYDIVNPFTYVDPSMAHDNPLQDFFLARDPDNVNILRRRYYYPGFDNGMVRVVGPKSYIPITSDADYLIVQNVPAIKCMIQAVEYRENNQRVEGQELYNEAREIILAEVKGFQMDPRWIMKRKGDYEADVARFQIGSKGWMRARLALEVPGALSVGKEEISRIIDRAQLRMMEAGTFKGCLEEFNARITDGHIYFPTRVESVLGANFDGVPISIRSMFYKYNAAGPGGWDCSCGGRIEDEGERFFSDSAVRRRVYRAHVGTDGSEITCVCKLRWEVKQPEEQLTIRNLGANHLMVKCILLEDKEKWDESVKAFGEAIGVLQRELREYLQGVRMEFSQAPLLGVGDLGVPL